LLGYGLEHGMVQHLRWLWTARSLQSLLLSIADDGEKSLTTSTGRRPALSRCPTGEVTGWFVLRRDRQNRGPRSTYLLLRLLLKNVRRIRLVNRAAHEPPAIRVVWPGYLTNTAPAPCRAAIFSRRVSKRLPVSRLASTQGWRSPSVCMTRTRVPFWHFFTM